MGWAALADILDYHQSGLTLADPVDEHLVESAWVFTFTPHGVWVIDVAGWTLSAQSVDAVIVGLTFAEEGVEVELLVWSTAVAVVIGTARHMRWLLAVAAILIGRCHQEQRQE